MLSVEGVIVDVINKEEDMNEGERWVLEGNGRR